METPNFEKEFKKEVKDLKDAIRAQGPDAFDSDSGRIGALEKGNDALRQTLLAQAEDLLQRAEAYCIKKGEISPGMSEVLYGLHSVKMALQPLEGLTWQQQRQAGKTSEWTDLSPKEKDERRKEFRDVKSFVDSIRGILIKKGYNVTMNASSPSDLLEGGDNIWASVDSVDNDNYHGEFIAKEGKIFFYYENGTAYGGGRAFILDKSNPKISAKRMLEAIKNAPDA